jgi:isochorismate pyruvate lyase
LREFLSNKVLNDVELEKKPAECLSKEEIRAHIDQLDKEIIHLFSLRFQYVKEIVKFKADAESVVAQDRKDQVIEIRGKWAEEVGLDSDTFQQIYRFLIDHNISKELEILQRKDK